MFFGKRGTFSWKLGFSVVGALIMVGVVGWFYRDTIFESTGTIDQLLDSLEKDCPPEPRIEQMARDMTGYAGDGSPVDLPKYAIDVWHEFDACTKIKDPAFTKGELDTYKQKIVNCAEVAYVRYLEDLNEKLEKAKKDDSAKGKIDVEDAEFLIAAYKKDHAIFLQHAKNLGITPKAECVYGTA